MTVAHNMNGSPGRHRLRTSHGAFWNSEVQAGVAVIRVAGELDAANLDQFADYARRALDGGHPIVLDLTKLDFLAAQGFRMLLDFDSECHRHGLDWAVVAGHSTARLLQVCDRDSYLPSSPSISQALQRFSPVSLQLVSKSS
jgi:anti-anti-sigma factor